jgi:hypothetical protein
MLSVIIPITVWRQIAGTAEPGSFKGKIIEVQTTPQVVGGNYVNMRIFGGHAASCRRCAVITRSRLNKTPIARLTRDHTSHAASAVPRKRSTKRFRFEGSVDQVKSKMTSNVHDRRPASRFRDAPAMPEEIVPWPP